MNAVLSITTKTDAEIAHSTDVLAAELEELRGLYGLRALEWGV